ncbi:IS1 family transposase [Microcoleus sp. MON1_C1]|uniref:IS1 family transposase n=1 Tax=Microcoleus sp. MON1_C1 TaxID=2818827 RepID=UPI002FD0E6DC
MKCPRCDSQYIVKNGHTHTGKQSFKCRDCTRQFVIAPRHQPISEDTKELIDRLLLEKIFLAAIVRATGVFPRWLQYYVNKKLRAVKRKVEVKSKKKGNLTIQCDEMWSFVGDKSNRQWIWLAIDVLTKEIGGVYLGKRDEAGARGLWDSLPTVYRQCAVSYTDFWSAYGIVFPKKKHRAVGKDTGQTNYIERFNNTLRKKIFRLGRKTLSFSKKLSTYMGAIWYVIHEYNASLSIT